MGMRRVVFMPLFGVLAFLPLQAQRGARGAGGGAFHGGVGYHGGAVASRGAVGAYRAAPQYSVRSQVPTNRWGGFGGDRFHHHHYYGYYGYSSYYYPSYGYVYPYAYSAYPFYDLGFYSDYSSNSNSEAYYAEQQQLNAEIGSLGQQMQQLRDENDNLRDYIVEHNAPVAEPDRRVPPSVSGPLQPDQAVAQRPTQPEKPSTPTEFVFKDGHTVDAPNYAIVDSTIWVLTGQRATKIPLAQLDLEKTKQVNEQRGVEFAAPPAQ